MAWIQINITVNEPLAEPLSDVFMEVGAVSVTFADAQDNPIYEPELGTTPIWQQTRVIALFDAETDAKAIISQLTAQMPELPENEFRVEPLEDKDWVRAWMDQFKPMQFGNNLWIVPSWCDAPDANAVNLLLDPGMAFGTGTHPTTALCLTWLDQNPPIDLSVIDYGCGSGVLALAAKKLGAQSVQGTDIDPQAILASQQNAGRNQADIPFSLVKDFQSSPVDCLLANILAGPLKELAPEFKRLLKPNGTLVLSGLLEQQADELIEFYRAQGFSLTGQNTLDDWAQLSFSHDANAA
ncbi:50S ribosomal protein L11 methyltransferase [Hydrogenovibrio sp. SC-1]|uniref:50S ribosomal protein L11 methyltransferase n=1 Tax=Hydrogenovibrio sp. SC-1 TaxID=2065820 RepID=UPI000C7B25B2|nr:50S ribosomal protein L11 methyltransferase [Hydrogenovibrio sp. SC-1]PLA75042.1 50S ribosomal protein L11 methyltransferase [Hydrogenovibrio sp. SC-1]